MFFDDIKIITGILVGFSLLMVGSPAVGELFATMAPIFPKKDATLLRDMGIPYEEIAFPTTDDLTLRGWFFPAEDLDAPVILYAPATARDQRSGLSLVQPLHEAGYQVLLFSYRGHGRSDGDRFGFTYGAEESKDIDAAVTFLSSKGINQIGAIGHSAGAVSAILSAARNPALDALVAASPFPSMEDIWYTNRPWFFPKALFELTFKLIETRKNFSRDEIRTQEVIGQIAPRPILLVHSLADKRITPKQANTMFDAANEPKCIWLVENASHAEVRSVILETQMHNIIAFFNQVFFQTGELACSNRLIMNGD